MFNFTMFGIPFFSIACCFFIYSFFGWIYESTLVSVRKKTWTNRGFLNGPIIPIYGCGGTLVFLLFYNSRFISLTRSVTALHIVIIFIVGMVCASVMEYFTSYVMEKLFHAKWWDYSDYPLNLEGRIAVRASLLWGLLSVLVAYLVQPKVNKLIDGLAHPLCDWMLIVFFALFLSDFVITVNATMNLAPKLEALRKLQEELREYSAGSKWYDKLEGAKEKFKNTRVTEWRKTLSNSKLHNYVYKRTFKAFPHFQMSGREQLLKEFKEKLHNIRR